MIASARWRLSTGCDVMCKQRIENMNVENNSSLTKIWIPHWKPWTRTNEQLHPQNNTPSEIVMGNY